MTRIEAMKLTDKEINQRLNELSKLLDMNVDWEKNYDEYCMLNSISNERYRRSNIGQFEEFFFNKIQGKDYEEIDSETWDWYSDWHKDMFGYRPKSTDKDW